MRRRQAGQDDDENQEIDPFISAKEETKDQEGKISYYSRKGSGIAILFAATFALYELNFVQFILYSPRITRVPWFNAGLVFTSIVLGCAIYIEGYRSFYLKQSNISYESATTTTHVLLASLIGAGVAFHIACWPLWGWSTIPYLFIFYYGVLFNIIVVFPVSIQRIAYITLYITFFVLYFF